RGGVSFDDLVVTEQRPACAQAANELDDLPEREEWEEPSWQESEQEQTEHVAQHGRRGEHPVRQPSDPRLQTCRSRRSLLASARRRAHTKAPEGTGGDLRSTGSRATNKSAVPDRRRVPRSPTLRSANLVPGAVPRITPRTGLAVQPAPSGKTKIRVRAIQATTGLSTKLPRNGPK